MLAIKRLNTFISVRYGGLIFQEDNILMRMDGTMLMIAEVAVIGIWGT